MRLQKEEIQKIYLLNAQKMLEEMSSKEDSNLRLSERKKSENSMKIVKKRKNLKKVY